jgi:hypothetical protein
MFTKLLASNGCFSGSLILAVRLYVTISIQVLFSIILELRVFKLCFVCVCLGGGGGEQPGNSHIRFLKNELLAILQTLLCEHDCKCSTSMMNQPHLSIGTSCIISMNSLLIMGQH